MSVENCRKPIAMVCKRKALNETLPLLALHQPANSHNICSIPLAYGRLQEFAENLTQVL